MNISLLGEDVLEDVKTSGTGRSSIAERTGVEPARLSLVRFPGGCRRQLSASLSKREIETLSGGRENRTPASITGRRLSKPLPYHSATPPYSLVERQPISARSVALRAGIEPATFHLEDGRSSN